MHSMGNGGLEPLPRHYNITRAQPYTPIFLKSAPTCCKPSDQPPPMDFIIGNLCINVIGVVKTMIFITIIVIVKNDCGISWPYFSSMGSYSLRTTLSIQVPYFNQSIQWGGDKPIEGGGQGYKGKVGNRPNLWLQLKNLIFLYWFLRM